MDKNWQGTLVELIILCKFKNVAREFHWGIGDNAPKICLGIKAMNSL